MWQIHAPPFLQDSNFDNGLDPSLYNTSDVRIASNIRQTTHRDILPIENVRFPLSAHTTFRLEEAPDWKDNTHNLAFVLDDVEIIKVMVTHQSSAHCRLS